MMTNQNASSQTRYQEKFLYCEGSYLSTQQFSSDVVSLIHTQKIMIALYS